VNSVVAAAAITAASTGGVAVVGMVTTAWTTLRAARSASARDRQASVYQQILAFASHQTETRRNTTRTIRYDKKTEARLQARLDAFTPPDWFEMQSQALDFCRLGRGGIHNHQGGRRRSVGSQAGPMPRQSN
jgi:hypothetical protein